MSSQSVIEMDKIHTTSKIKFALMIAYFMPNPVLARYTFTPDGGAINVAKHGNKRESLPLCGGII